jgi:hypothetical protein
MPAMISMKRGGPATAPIQPMMPANFAPWATAVSRCAGVRLSPRELFTRLWRMVVSQPICELMA